MKTSHTLTLALLVTLTGFAAQAQSLVASTYLERTSVGPKVGSSIGYVLSDGIEIGGFYQNAFNAQQGVEKHGKWFEREFYGAYLNYPIFIHHNTTIKMNVRTGVSNGENFVITPSLLANYQVLKKISVGGGLGVRTFRPTYQATFKIRL